MFPATTENEFPSEIISELAKGTEDATTIFRRHGVPLDHAAKVVATEEFRRALKAAQAQWASSENLEERIRTKALFAVEEMMPHQYAMAIDPDIAPAARNETFKIFKGLSGLDRRIDEGGPVGGGFSITLNMGGALQKEIVVSGTDPDEEEKTARIPQVTEYED